MCDVRTAIEDKKLERSLWSNCAFVILPLTFFADMAV